MPPNRVLQILSVYIRNFGFLRLLKAQHPRNLLPAFVRLAS